MSWRSMRPRRWRSSPSSSTSAGVFDGVSLDLIISSLRYHSSMDRYVWSLRLYSQVTRFAAASSREALRS